MSVLKGYIKAVSVDSSNTVLDPKVFKEFERAIIAQVDYLITDPYSKLDFSDFKVENPINQIYDEEAEELKYYEFNADKIIKEARGEVVGAMVVFFNKWYLKKGFERTFIAEMPVLNAKGYINTDWHSDKHGNKLACIIYKK